MKGRLGAAMVMVSTASLAAHAGGTNSWLMPVSGSWNDGTNWSTGLAPDSDDQAEIGLLGAYTVTTTSNAAALSLNITNSDAVLIIDNSRVFDLFGDLSNEGLINVNPTGGGFATQFDFESDATITGSGEIRLGSADVRARLRSGSGFSVTQSAGHTIAGYGQIEAGLINDGLVSADVPNQSIVLTLDQKVNNATMQAVNAGVLNFGPFTLDQGAGGELVADGTDSLLNFSGTSVTGGTIRAINGGRADVNNATFDAVTLEGTHQLLNSRTLAVFNSITNNGILTINPSGGGFATQLDFENSGAFNGAGSVRLASVSVRARLRSAVGATMTNSADHSILGYGQIEAALINDGLVSADVSGQELLLTAENKSNNATMQAVNAGILDFGLFTLNQSGPGLVAADGDQSRIDLNSTTIVGGTVQTSNGATVEIQTATLDAVQSQSDMNVLNGNTLSVRNGLVNNGTIVVNSIGGGFVTQISWLSDDPITGDGSIVLNSSDVRARLLLNGATRAELGSGQHLSGIGLIQAPLLHHGTIAPGLGVGTMFASSPVEFSDSSVFEAEVSGSGADLLDSSSTVQLDGTLEVVFVDGFTPAGFWARTIIEGSGITEKFDAVVVPAPAPGLVTRVLNTGSAVIVGQTCPSDTNLDGALNFFDVSAFLNAFQAMDPIADLTGDGQFNFFDVSAFLNNFGSGCGL